MSSSRSLTEEERAKFADVEFLTELRVPDNEPFAYLGGGDTVLVSAASLRFLEDIVMAHTWTSSQGLSLQTIADYLMMLRNWDEAKGRPPKPWDVLCIPADALTREPFGDQAYRVLNSAAAFAFLHEYGHVLHGHPGNDGVSPDVSRANEAAADAFALDIFARVGDVPLGMTILFFTMSHLHEIRSQFQTDDEYMRTLAARTHPVSPQRLLSLARHLTAQSEVYGRKFRRRVAWRRSVLPSTCRRSPCGLPTPTSRAFPPGSENRSSRRTSARAPTAATSQHLAARVRRRANLSTGPSTAR